MLMSTSSSKPVAHHLSKNENARVFIVVYEGAIRLANKLLQSAEASGNPTGKFIFVGTDGTEMPGKFRNLPLDLPQGNPVSVNRAFMEVAEMCFKNRDDFIFFDPDVTFMKPKAIERLSFELTSRDGTVLGQPVWTHNDDFHGWSWNGNAAYKWETWERFNLENEPIPDDQPFDLWLSKKFFQGHCAGTGLYHNTLDKKNVENLDWVPEECCIHHPCSDGSVADLVMEKYMSHA